MNQIKPSHPLVTEFVNELTKQRNWTEGTQRCVIYCLRGLLEFCGKEPTRIEEKEIIEFFKKRKEQEYWDNSSTMFRALWIIRMFYKFLFEKKYVSELYQIKIKICKEVPENFDRNIYRAVRKQKGVVDRYSVNIRDRTIWYLLYFSTASTADISQIKIKNVFLDKNYIYLDDVVEGRLHYIILQNCAAEALRLYFTKCRIDSEYLFPQADNKNEPMRSDYVYTVMRNIALKAGIKIGARERMELKLSIAIQANVDIHTLQCMFGIKNLARFQKFLDKRNKRLRPFRATRKIANLSKTHNLN